MSRMLASALIGLLALSSTALAQADVAGNWELTVNGPQGAITAGAAIKQDGEKLSGKFSGPQGDSEMTGTIKDNKISLSFTVQTQQGPINVTMNAEVNGASMKGVVDYSMGTADFTGTKK